MKSMIVSSELFRSGLLRFSIAALLVAVVAAPASATVVAAIASASVDGTSYDVPVGSNPDGLFGIGSWDSSKQNFTGWSVQTADYKIQISGAMDPDPISSYGITVTDFGAPSTFGFFFSTPIALGPGPTTVNASVSGSLGDFTGNGVSITPTLGDPDGDGFPELQVNTVGLPTTNMGVDVGLANAHAAAPPTTYPLGPYNAGPQPGPAGPWSTLDMTVGFILSGGGDTATLNGLAQIETVPEPSTFVLGALSILGLVWHIRRRK
ncbi:MAG TPA: PEP-CTERM sorting domain-containing protein [Pirellulales bacterium]|nr:PEP-CTERM sorting domain-containing protein [Pirellulales bacterium]